MGFSNATFGLYGGFAVFTLPAMLAAQGIPGGRVAAIVAAVLSPGFWIFVFAPVLDVRFSRRTYAFVFTALAGLAAALAVMHRQNVAFVEAAVLLGYVAASLVQGAVGGWTGSLIAKEDDGRLGTWFAVANTGSAGVMAIVSGQLVTRLPATVAGPLIGLLLMLPMGVYRAIPAPGPDRRLARESFGRFFGDIVALVKRREVLIALMLFMLPSASFTLTNVLGGIGKDFSATERMVSLFGGVGAAFAGVFGSLLLQPLAKRFPLRPIYLGVGLVGACFTLSLLLLPRTPWAFAVAITGENVFQALAFATGNAITFEVIGPGNPLAATLFSLLIAATNLPIVYMGFVDGHAYDLHGLPGTLLSDAGLSIAVCSVLAIFLRRYYRSGRGHAA